jgi:outer membrane protein
MKSRFNQKAYRKALIATAALSLGITCSTAVLAQNSASDAKPSQSEWSLGAGVVTQQKVYRDIDRENYVLPLVSYENKWVSLSVPKADFKLYSTESLSLRLRARYDSDGYDPDDSSFLTGMDKRKSSIWVGGALLWKNDIANVSAEVLTDSMGNSNGTRAGLKVDHRFGLGAFGLTPSVGVEWFNDNYVDYYYGVRASEATVVRGVYQGDSTTAVDVGLRLDYSPSVLDTVFLDVSAKRFGSAIEDSPIVEEATQTTVSLGYLYRF